MAEDRSGTLPRKKVLRRLIGRTLTGRRPGLEAYVWLAQRLTGLVLFFFLLWHLATLSAIFSGERHYDATMASMQSAVYKAGEILLLWVVFFHLLNGTLLIVFNLFPLVNHKTLAVSASALSVALTIAFIPFVI